MMFSVIIKFFTYDVLAIQKNFNLNAVGIWKLYNSTL